jgi:hypothetical protein
MKVIACRLPDGTVERIAPVLPILWWLQAGRTEKDVEGYVSRAAGEGVKREKALALVTEFLNQPANPTPYQIAMRDGGLTEDEAYMVIAEKDCPNAVERLISESVPLAHSKYREFCVPRGGKLEWDMERARGRHRDYMRHARKPLLASLDVEYQRADEAGDVFAKQSIAARKQRLRDCTQMPEIENAATIEELINVWPQELRSEVK